MPFEDIQYELLGKFVEAHLATSQDTRGVFIVSWPHNEPQATFFHSREQTLRFQGSISDAEVLAHAGLLLKSQDLHGGVTFQVLPQGINAYWQWRSKSVTLSTGAKDSRNVFVVHGRNEAARKALFDFLRSIGLHPLEWSEAVSASGKGAPFIGEVLDVAYSQVQAVVVLLTGDDLAMLAPALQQPDDLEIERQPTPQARPNVLFEAGMAFGRHPQETILVQLGALRPFSDIGGRHVIRLSDTMASRQDLANRLKAAGCSVKLSGTDWHNSGDFEGAVTATKPARLSSAWTSFPRIQDSELSILKFLRQQEDTVADSGLTVQEIATALSLPLSTSKHYLAELEDKELVSVQRYMGGNTEYSIGRRGRSLLIQVEGSEHT